VTFAESFYVADGEHELTATKATAGPWAEHLQHGGPPSALLVRAAEQAVAREDVVALRAAVDFLSPVPVGPLTATATVTKPGRTAVAVDAELSAAGRTVLRGRVWLVRLTDGGPRVAAAGDQRISHPDDLPAAPLRWTFPYAVHMDWRTVDGDPDGPGEAHVWARQRVPLVAGEETTGLQRVLVAADSGSGVSAVLDWDRWSFVNVDLDVHLLRPAVGEWVALDAVTRVWPTGSAQCTTTLRDVAGWLGTAAQTLVVQPR
jgi:acyl-coenzyme A thioesterase PaaI-like protein